MIATSTTNLKACCQCGKYFKPFSSTQVVCRQLCAERKVKADKAAKAAIEKAMTEARVQAAKPRSKWLSECQAIVNKIVRIRDAKQPCVSCDRGPGWDGQWHASHLRSTGAASAVRFSLWNIHKACSICNNHLSGNIADYLPRVRARIGDAKVDWLYQQNQLVKHDVPYLSRFKAVMGERLKRMEKRQAKHRTTN